MEAGDKKFWELEAGPTWDVINTVGLRNHYICTVHGARQVMHHRLKQVCLEAFKTVGNLN